ncbi:MAG: PIN domain-containing protein, partial [Acidimicrobiia bacterium]
MASSRRAPGALFCDTNVLIRFLADDPLGHAEAVQRALEAAGNGRFAVVVTDVVLAEIAYVLTGAYRRSRKDA